MRIKMDNDIVITRIDGEDEGIGEFINKEFSDYARANDVALNYNDFCFAAKDEDGQIMGVITGRSYYDEVHIVDLIVNRNCRRSGLGSRLVKTVEESFLNRGYKVITLTTFGFQAPEFYKKLGYKLEFVRENSDPKISKYFFRKEL